MNILKSSILNRTREEIQALVDDGLLKKETLKHYDICKAMAQGMTQEKATEVFGLTDDRYVRQIKKTKCPDCGHTKNQFK